MMIKYRVNEVARDFGVPGKEIIKLLEQYTGTTKKSQTALEENELDIIFEHYTQAHQEDNFDRYFAVAAEAEKKREEEKAAKREAEKAEKAAKAAAEKPAVKGAAPAATAEKPAKKDKEDKPHPAKPAVERRTVDTRRPQQMNAHKYDEKFDTMAQSTSKGGRGDFGPRKQKINQKSQQYRKPHGRRETEAERMKRIQLERQKKPITIMVGDTGRLEALIKKLRTIKGVKQVSRN